jgi:ABC-type multidrug transport system fused ATPase/permease subunit
LALVSPALPLLRGSVRRNLTLRRSKATPAEVTAALILVGLDPVAFPPDRRIDPALGQPDPFTQARLRLARALVHRPKRLFLAEPLLLTAPDYPALVQRLSAEGITVEDDPAHAPTWQRSPAPG